MESADLSSVPEADLRAESVDGLRCRVTTRFSPAAEAVLTTAAARLPVVPFPTTGTSVAEVVAAPGLTRVTELDRKQTATWTVVRDERDGSSVFWDHQQRSCIRFAAEELGRDEFGPYEGLKWATESRDRDTTHATVTVFDHALGALRLDLEFRDGLVPIELGGLVLEAIVGSRICHAESGFPLREFGELGCLVAYRTFIGDSADAAVDVVVDEIESRNIPLDWFRPPDGFEPLTLIERVTEADDGDGSSGGTVTIPARRPADDAPRMGRSSQALMAEEPLTPDCMGSTRYGSMAGVIRQDLFDHVTSLLNTAVPLLGTATLAGGLLIVPWLSNLAAINTANSSAPGSGLFALLRNPRVPAPPGGKATGGAGLLDRLAWKFLATKDDSGMARLQYEFAAGTLGATLGRWGIPAATTAKLTMAGGDLNALTENEQIAVVEGYEMSDLATVMLSGMPSSLPASGPPYNWAGLITMTVTGIVGSVNCSTIPVGGFITANIGSNADVDVSVMVPDSTFVADVTRALTPDGWAALAGVAVSCLFFPFGCGVAITLAATLAYLLNNVTRLIVTSSATSIALNVQFGWDPSVQRVEPKVSVVSAGGTVNVVNVWVTPNVLTNLFETAILGLANLFNIWPTVIALVSATALQEEMTKHGIGFPVGITALEADEGGAWSAPGSSLTMFAGIKPFFGSSVQPYLTQVPTVPVITHRLEDAIAVMWHDVNPQPTPPPPGPGKATMAGLYGGLSLSQNALNYYLFSQWRARMFELVITDPAMILKIDSLLPTGVLARSPVAIHLWPAVPPRVEVSMDGLTTDRRPIIVFFDDVRACFEVPTPPNDTMPGVRGLAELSFNFKTTASLTIDWPFVVRMPTDAGPFATTACDIRVEEFFDPNNATVMSTNGVAHWQPVAEALAFMVVNANNASKLTKPVNPLKWNRPTPGITQSLSGDELYLEILGLRRVIQLLPVFNQAVVLELIDGSGAPTLNALLGTTAAPVSLATMTFAQGIVVRPLLGLVKGLPAFPPP